MKFFIVLSALVAVALAKPGLWQSSHHVASPLVHAAPEAYVKLVPAAPIGHDGRVVDTPEVAHAKAEHLAAHEHEKISLAEEAGKSVDEHAYSAAAPALFATSYHTNEWKSLPVAHSATYHSVAPVTYIKLVPAAPLGHDGRVVDTLEVAHAKAEHLAAHEHEKISLAEEAGKSVDEHTYSAAAPALFATSYLTNEWESLPVAHSATYHSVAPVTYTKLVPAAPLGHDGRVVDTLEVAHAKAEHLAAHEHEKISLAEEAGKSIDEHTYEAGAPALLATSYQAHSVAHHAAAPISLW